MNYLFLFFQSVESRRPPIAGRRFCFTTDRILFSAQYQQLLFFLLV